MERTHRCSGFCVPLSPTQFGGADPSPYPPTLFSLDNYKVSCDGSLDRTLTHYLEDVSLQFYAEGVYLLTVAIVVGFLRLLGLCARDSTRIPLKKPAAYGATARSDPGIGSPSPPRYTTQGVLR